MRFSFFIFFLIFAVLTGCEQSPIQHKTESIQAPQTQVSSPPTSESAAPSGQVKTAVPKPEPTPPTSDFQPFYVFESKGSRQNHFVPSGFMPNGNCVTFSDVWQNNCQNGTTCIKIQYDVECSRKDEKWAGVYWLNPANNWGSRKGGFDLTGAERLTFWAKGEKGGEQIQEFTIGGITGDYPDSDTAVIGPVILGTQWRQYTIDLRGKDLSYISGGFAWTTSEDVNPENCTFYLDNIKYE